MEYWENPVSNKSIPFVMCGITNDKILKPLLHYAF